MFVCQTAKHKNELPITVCTARLWHTPHYVLALKPATLTVLINYHHSRQPHFQKQQASVFIQNASHKPTAPNLSNTKQQTEKVSEYDRLQLRRQIFPSGVGGDKTEFIVYCLFGFPLAVTMQQLPFGPRVKRRVNFF